MSLIAGQKAPDFLLPDQNGKVQKLSDFLGKWVLVYFYPKDDTPGCTAEACSLRDNLPRFQDGDAVILGVSVDSVDSHAKFAKKYSLNFTLLADENKELVKKYGVWEEKSLFGKKFMGVLRTSFLIDPEGQIAKIYQKVKPEIHAREVLEDLKRLK